jgi:hypothetical protein
MTRPCQSNLSITLAHPEKTAQIFPDLALSIYKDPFNKDQAPETPVLLSLGRGHHCFLYSDFPLLSINFTTFLSLARVLLMWNAKCLGVFCPEPLETVHPVTKG